MSETCAQPVIVVAELVDSQVADCCLPRDVAVRSLNGRSPITATTADGSLNIWMQREDPGPERRAN